MSKFKQYFKENWAPAIIITLTVIVCCFGSIIVGKSEKDGRDRNYFVEIYRDNIELMYNGARADLVENIDFMIQEVAPTSCMNGLSLLRGCEEYDVDIFFVLAQAQLESHYGTRGLAARTNSVFNVFAYDGHDYDRINKNGKYQHPDLSIEPYLKLLKEKYLVNGKTENDLLINYVNSEGKRYASDEQYETRLLNIYNKILENNLLQSSFKEYNKYKILSGR